MTTDSIPQNVDLKLLAEQVAAYGDGLLEDAPHDDLELIKAYGRCVYRNEVAPFDVARWFTVALYELLPEQFDKLSRQWDSDTLTYFERGIARHVYLQTR